jgi:hypothetical protein
MIWGPSRRPLGATVRAGGHEGGGDGLAVAWGGAHITLVTRGRGGSGHPSRWRLGEKKKSKPDFCYR